MRDAEAERYKSVVSRFFKAVRPIHFTLIAMIQAQRYYEPLDFTALNSILSPPLITNRESVHLVQIALEKENLVQFELNEYDASTDLTDIKIVGKAAAQGCETLGIDKCLADITEVPKGLSYGSKSWAKNNSQWVGPELLMPKYSGDAQDIVDHIQGYSWTTPLIFPGTRGKLSASLRVTLRLDSLADLPNSHGMTGETEVFVVNDQGDVVLSMERDELLEFDPGSDTHDYITLRPFLRPRKIWELTGSYWSDALRADTEWAAMKIKECDPAAPILEQGSFAFDCFPFDDWLNVNGAVEGVYAPPLRVVMWSTFTEFQTEQMLGIGIWSMVVATMPFFLFIWKVLWLSRTHFYRTKAKDHRDKQMQEADDMMTALTAETGIPSYLQMKADRKGRKKVDQKFKLGEAEDGSSDDDADTAKQVAQGAAAGAKALGAALSVFKKHRMSGKSKSKRQVFGMQQ